MSKPPNEPLYWGFSFWRIMLTQKQETFTVNYFESGKVTESALLAGYSPKTAFVIGSENLTKPKIQERLLELRAKVESAKVANVEERQQILTEIARGRLTDFMECGQDGSWINIDSEKMNTHAIQGIDSKTEYDENGSNPTVVTKIKLHNPINAIAELNKMDHVYEPESKTVNYNDIKILVVYDEQKRSPVVQIGESSEDKQ